ncbi:hypothetical protein LWI28_025279 [Acer negundo]|uniref:RING-type E3 ubiquitin transferase n=1 Tax=Acer negundo TaxID=4023 RepID=A0AAD5IKJ6_ACENE|nr:hypothetical protein LWI28_025279 [Acer negundo]KAK4840802.1 hypothetical protein QYF36_018573 [Acer negundo]
MGDDHDAPSGSNEGGNRFVNDTVMHQFSHVTGNGRGAGMETVSMMHQSPIVQRNERPSISTEYPENPVLGPDVAGTRNTGNTVQTTNQFLTPDQFSGYNNYQVQDTDATPLLRIAPPPLQQQPPLPQGPAANGNNGTLWPAGIIVAGPSEQRPLVRPNNMPVAPSERQAAADSAEHQEMIRDMLIAQIREGLRHLRRQSDTIEHDNPLHNFSEDDEDNDNDNEDERDYIREALRQLGRQGDAILEILSDDDDDIEDEDNDDNDDNENEEDMSLDIDDLSLDLDNMSLEGLLELEEDIETVSSQLHEENIGTIIDIIQANLRQHKYQPVEADSPADGNCCCVCLEEYAAGDNIGKLDNCVHEYHVTCITLWLKRQNSCPACKAVALNALE